jgi:hypothetical protein
MFELGKITTPATKPMTLSEVDIPLPHDMSLRSERIEPNKLRKKLAPT